MQHRRMVTVPESTMLDKVIERYAPSWGLKRKEARIRMALADAYTGASRRKRSLKNYNPPTGSADDMILGSLDALRDRSRDLARNNPIATGAIETKVSKVVGKGLQPKSRIEESRLGIDPEVARAIEKDAEWYFRKWAGSKEPDITGHDSLLGLLELVWREELTGGDVLIVRRFDDSDERILGTCYQIIESDRLCNPPGKSDSDKLAGGVELDNNGKATAYWVCDRHPDSVLINNTPNWTRIPAYSEDGRKQVHHLFKRKREGQHRGVPFLTPVIEWLKQIGNYTEAEITAAVVQGFLTVFVTSSTGDDILTGGNPSVPTSSSGDDGYNDVSMGAGAVVKLKPNDDVKTVDPSRPNSGFQPFVEAMLRQVGMGLNIPFEVLCKHFTSSYTAARAAMQDAYATFMRDREHLVQDFLQYVWADVFLECVARDYIEAAGIFADKVIQAAYLGSEWFGDAPPQIDPVKEVNAAILRNKARWTTNAYECAGLTGRDHETVITQLSAEEELEKKAGFSQEPEGKKEKE